ncbi:hypothetical protein BpHYR1_020266 [Brachionus plicatilis]|uniref:Uncharacterized protein n=1 Tax=Brachionus plicatilis TaxID=10195 RepID=A0A3M7QKJ3_BRAPC|nr:hypothetical protein BpHYR1_020266 [Brachionus plicatilis]
MSRSEKNYPKTMCVKISNEKLQIEGKIGRVLNSMTTYDILEMALYNLWVHIAQARYIGKTFLNTLSKVDMLTRFMIEIGSIQRYTEHFLYPRPLGSV